MVSPALVLFLKYLKLFDLRPMGHWSFDAAPASFLAAAVGAVLAFYPLRPRWRVINLFLGLGLFLASLYFYDLVARVPPTQANKALYNLGAYSTYFLCYLSFGFSIAHICKFFTQQKDLSAP